MGLPLPAPPIPTHYSGSSGIIKLRRYELQPVPAHGPLYYVTQYDAISDLPDILGASTSAFSGDFRSQFYGYHHGVKSYKTRPLNNYQAMMREYKDEPRVALQVCLRLDGTRALRKSLTKCFVYARITLYSIVTFPPSRLTPRFWPRMIRTRGIGYRAPSLV